MCKSFSGIVLEFTSEIHKNNMPEDLRFEPKVNYRFREKLLAELPNAVVVEGLGKEI